jgi:HEPN domain-containing protein
MKKASNEARRWFLQAKDDLKFVNWIQKEGVFFDKGCFISQQAGEKILKACLYMTGKRFVLGHSLMEMLLELEKKDNIFRDIRNEAKRLDRFYIPTRYPNGLPGGSPFQVYLADDLIEACKDLKKLFEISKRFLEKQGFK